MQSNTTNLLQHLTKLHQAMLTIKWLKTSPLMQPPTSSGPFRLDLSWHTSMAEVCESLKPRRVFSGEHCCRSETGTSQLGYWWTFASCRWYVYLFIFFKFFDTPTVWVMEKEWEDGVGERKTEHWQEERIEAGEQQRTECSSLFRRWHYSVLLRWSFHYHLKLVCNE